MVVITPPRQSDSHDAEFTVEPDRGGEALIEEAKQHARRRRRRVAITGIMAAVAVIGAVTAAFVADRAGSSSSGTSSSPADAGIPAVGLADGEQVDAVASWAGYNRGWGIVFTDGRVLRWPSDEGILQLRLSVAALDLVRSGRLAASDVWRDLASTVWPDDSAFDREGWWADQVRRAYVPTQFAACPVDRTAWLPASEITRRLPNAARDILSGTQRIVPVATFEEMPTPTPTGHECFVLTSAQVSAITPLSAGSAQAAEEGELKFPKGYLNQPLTLSIVPLMPDGSMVHWGG